MWVLPCGTLTDGAFEERGSELPFLAAPPPTRERMTAILARVHDAIVAQDPDAELDPALATTLYGLTTGWQSQSTSGTSGRNAAD